jgi:hypothetical protein
LALVDGKPLLDQWRQRPKAHLGLPGDPNGQLADNGADAGGHHRRTCVMDPATFRA